MCELVGVSCLSVCLCSGGSVVSRAVLCMRVAVSSLGNRRTACAVAAEDAAGVLTARFIRGISFQDGEFKIFKIFKMGRQTGLSAVSEATNWFVNLILS